MIYGIDALAIAKYPELLKDWPKGFALGVFWDTFGPVRGVLEDYCKRSLGPLVRVQGQWDDNHRFGPSNFPKAIAIGQAVSDLKKKYPHIRFQYSPFCEDKLSTDAKLPIFRQLSEKFPNLELVNSSIRGGGYVPGVINEIHHNDKPTGNPPGKINFSYDGLAGSKKDSRAGNGCVDSNVEKWKKTYAHAEVFWFWVLQCNMKWGVKDETDRPNRRCKPTPKLFKSLAYYAGTKSVVKLDKGWLYKSHAEQHGNVDNRANRPVVLAPVGWRGKSVSVGGVVFTPSGSTDGRKVFRCLNKFGFEMKRFAAVKADGKTVGTVDCGYRENEWKDG
jgi:hypothetical protein